MAIPKKYPAPPPDFPLPEKHPETAKPVDPEEEDPDYIPDEEPDTLPPYEVPPPGEGP